MNDDLKNCMAYWCKMHEESVGAKYLISYGKDQALMKQIIATYGVNKTFLLIGLFFRELRLDKFLQQTGASVGVFKSQIPKLLLKLNEKQEKESIGKWTNY